LTYTTSNPYELQFGYSRAVRKGPHIFVSGTTSIDPETGYVQFPDSAYQQALVIFKEIINSVEHLQGSKEDIARVRMFVTEQEDTEAVGRALMESLGDLKPAATMIVGARFVDKYMKVEIEADAVVVTSSNSGYVVVVVVVVWMMSFVSNHKVLIQLQRWHSIRIQTVSVTTIHIYAEGSSSSRKVIQCPALQPDQKATCMLRPSNSRWKHLCLLISYANWLVNPFSSSLIFVTPTTVDKKVIFGAVTTP